MYLELLKLSLTGALAQNSDLVLGKAGMRPGGGIKRRVANAIADALGHAGLELVQKRPWDPEARARGLDWPQYAETMIGLRRIENLKMCVESVIADRVPGDLIETGVWRGGACIFMRGVLKAHGVTDRTVWAADSFEGLPKPDPRRYPVDTGDSHHEQAPLRIGVDQVRSNFARYGLLDDQVQFLVGWFKDTLPGAPIKQLAVLRLDGDMYESTMDALVALYDKLSVGGYLIIDDFNLRGCHHAILDFRKERGISEEILEIDGSGAYWRRVNG